MMDNEFLKDIERAIGVNLSDKTKYRSRRKDMMNDGSEVRRRLSVRRPCFIHFQRQKIFEVILMLMFDITAVIYLFSNSVRKICIFLRILCCFLF